MQNTKYINTITLQYPITEKEIRSSNPNTSYPSPFKPGEGYAVVFPTPQPVFNPVIQSLVERKPVNEGGKWYQRWEAVSKFQEYTDDLGVIHTVAEQEEAAIASHIAKLKDEKWNHIKLYRDNLTQTGGYKAGDKWFHSDTFSRSQQLGLVLLGNNIPSGLMWKTMDGSFIEMTQALAQEVFQAATIQDSSIFAYAESINKQIQDSNDLEFIQSFDIKSGWPETYQVN